jgi:DNA (cytosine-5)-methyltransferase 1
VSAIPVVDVFAGPGGLAEGFSSLEVGGRRAFRIALSIEKDANAHRTLRLRGFYRQFKGDLPEEYWALLRGECVIDDLYARYPKEFKKASEECIAHELGPASDTHTRSLVTGALAKHSGPWGLIGGPPCQAYSLVGRSRNRGIEGYVPENDHRQTLYVEYLQILADHRPAFFVMENVKGLLSATHDSEKIFGRILSDLRDPSTALRREGRRAPSRGPEYEIHSISNASSGLFGPSAKDMIIRSEEYGIPQARHRVILLGVLKGATKNAPGVLTRTGETSLWSVLSDLPKLRSGLTDRDDSAASWCHFIRTVARQPWVRSLDASVRDSVVEACDKIASPLAGRGGEFVRSRRLSVTRLGGVVNHATRGHIAADLERYLFASCFARVMNRSPVLEDFPEALLPKHKNVVKAIKGSLFNDRFRVQLRNRPSTTITSHISKDGHYYIHPDSHQCRSLTVREAARLQSFPDDYFFCGPRTSQYHQVGNAVPPELARRIAEIVSRLF